MIDSEISQRKPPQRGGLWAAALAVAVVSAGCSPSDGQVETHPASGQVTIDGKPAEGAIVTLYPVDTAAQPANFPIPQGTVGADGSFKVKSYTQDDGAPVGEYRATVVWPAPAPPDAYAESVNRSDRLRGRYADPGNSDIVVKIESGTNEIPPIAL